MQLCWGFSHRRQPFLGVRASMPVKRGSQTWQSNVAERHVRCQRFTQQMDKRGAGIDVCKVRRMPVAIDRKHDSVPDASRSI